MLTTSARRHGGAHCRYRSKSNRYRCPTGQTKQASRPAGSGGSYRTKGDDDAFRPRLRMIFAG